MPELSISTQRRHARINLYAALGMAALVTPAVVLAQSVVCSQDPAERMGSRTLERVALAATATGADAAEKAGNGFFSRSATEHCAEHTLNAVQYSSRGLWHARDALRHHGPSGGMKIRLQHSEWRGVWSV